MASKDTVPSFQEFVTKKRKERDERQEHQDLANKIFGGRRTSAPSSLLNRRGGPTIRGGVKKVRFPHRSSAAPPPDSSGSLNVNISLTNPPDKQRYQDANSRAKLEKELGRGRSTPDSSGYLRKTFGSQLDLSRLNDNAAPKEMHIRGTAPRGPFTVVLTNLSPGTSVADLQSSLKPLGGEMQSCRIVAYRPNMIAEAVFASQDGAANVVNMFNEQLVDGRRLNVFIKTGPPSLPAEEPKPATYSFRRRSEPDAATPRATVAEPVTREPEPIARQPQPPVSVEPTSPSTSKDTEDRETIDAESAPSAERTDDRTPRGPSFYRDNRRDSSYRSRNDRYGYDDRDRYDRRDTYRDNRPYSYENQWSRGSSGGRGYRAGSGGYRW